ncbi:hypothetical protein CC80DRAFT_495925 [Byssothecium circinans]|uniref:Calcineurin-like phosphoesterase domain-containing protein n=1 Tax=Byssothecium circinans TaxID=147558 RepID=A0A6A5TLT7_9PLEO|nr:hypothetical protein CC80DRAFT_495925 [Byssothecium circinans]
MASRSLKSLCGLMSPIFPLKAKAKAKTSRRLQFMSDLHLEIGQQYMSFDFPTTAPFLVLGGDIGRLVDYDGYLAFLQRQATRYERVFLVLGNHEFYGMSYGEGLERAGQLVCEPALAGKTTLLQQGRYELDLPGARVIILGCVLWSRIAAESAERVAMAVSDFKQIRGWTVDAHNAAHAADLAWLQAEMECIQREKSGERERERVVVVITHHAPLVRGTASPRHDDSPYRSAFATDLLCRHGIGADCNRVKFWVFGHTHWTTDFAAASGVRLVSNQRGYVFPGNTRPIDQGPMDLTPKHTFDPGRYIQL